MEAVVVIFLLLVLFFSVVKRKVVTKYVPDEFNYSGRKHYFSDKEQALYTALLEAVGKQGIIQSKVSLAHLVTPKELNKKRLAKAHANALKVNFDFIVIDPNRHNVVCGIVINDGKKLNPKKATKEKTILTICKKANIPVIGLSPQHAYRVNAIRLKLSPYLAINEEKQNIKFCPKCGSPMIIRAATQGELSGRRFYVCSRAPTCTYVENIMTD